MGLKNGEKLTIEVFLSMTEAIEKVDLIQPDGELNPLYLKALNRWFSDYSIQEKMGVRLL